MYRIRVWDETRPDVIFKTDDLQRAEDAYKMCVHLGGCVNKNFRIIEIALERLEDESPYGWEEVVSEVIS
jgi:hypothetical protein